MGSDLQLIEHVTNNKKNINNKKSIHKIEKYTYLKDDHNQIYRFIKNDFIREVFDTIDRYTLRTISLDFEKNIKLTNNQVGLHVFPNSFSGKDAIDFLVLHKHAKNRKHALHVGRLLSKELSLFHHVIKTEKLEDLETLFYFITNVVERPKKTALRKSGFTRNIFAGMEESEKSLKSLEKNVSDMSLQFR